ncbi:hypothetical protein LOTGIDRAFT_229826 [Lottia gigantea]|uniref:Uncharacterized protein n=1 Tax=Lottia gigantea TaxID=225164 RepID=V3ZKB1_LOTGI|nr:hypothetical protein LOTGIDRAFT_229826 [Lottia gigantea]ESO82815.1 hypothetical protein LOTGIDRAFT_229826 [Lottia gigantea]
MEYLESSLKAVKFLAGRLNEKGQQPEEDTKNEISAIYKLPNQLLLSGQEALCNKVLDDIKERFLAPNGDFESDRSKTGWQRKTSLWLLAYNWPYVNGWMVVASQRAARFDISRPAYDYVKTFFHPVRGGFLWREAYDSSKGGEGIDQSMCAFMTAHLGYTALTVGDWERAKAAGEILCQFVAKQPNLDKEFLMKMDSSTGELVAEGYSAEDRTFFSVVRTEADNRYYQLGFPAIFLQKLYLATAQKHFLNTACAILDFADTCHPNIYKYYKTHKVGYGAALVARATGNEKYKIMAQKIADNMVSFQDPSGIYLPNCPLLERLDQSAEYAGWLREIYVELDGFTKQK